MKGVCLNFYVNEFQKQQARALYEWLLESAKKQDLEGGSAFRSIAGYGRHGKLHSEHFFELGSNVPILVTFITDEKKAQDFLQMIRKEGLSLFYTLFPIEYGITT